MGKSKRTRKDKSCDNCLQDESVLFRIRMQASEPWQFFCSSCLAVAKQDEHYQYGGTWKQKKRN